jgi:hypothetical protein
MDVAYRVITQQRVYMLQHIFPRMHTFVQTVAATQNNFETKLNTQRSHLLTMTISHISKSTRYS